MTNRKGGHSQTHLVLTRKIKADTGIAPLIAWLNKQNNIVTHFSCQGQGRGEEGAGFPRPMVTFHAITRNALYKMLRRLGLDRGRYEDEALGLRLTHWEVHGNTNYKLEWADRASLDRTMRTLNLQPVEEP
jgi:hypothetical protein